MAQPFDYSLKIPAPGEAFLSGMQIGQQQQQVEAQRARAEAERNKQTRLVNFSADAANWIKNPTPDGYKELMAKYPEFQQEITAAQKSASAAERPVIRSLATEALMAHRNKKPEMVVELIDQRIKAAEGNPQLVQKFQDMKSVYQQYSDNPKLQESLIVSALAQDEVGSRIYEKAFRETEPYVVAGDNLYLKSDIDRAVAEAEKTGSSDVKVTPVIPMGAVSMLKSNPKLAADFDKKYGTPANPNPSAQILGGQTGSAPSGGFR